MNPLSKPQRGGVQQPHSLGTAITNLQTSAPKLFLLLRKESSWEAELSLCFPVSRPLQGFPTVGFFRSIYWLIFFNLSFVIFRLLLSRRQAANRSFSHSLEERRKRVFSSLSCSYSKIRSGTPHLHLNSWFLLLKHKHDFSWKGAHSLLLPRLPHMERGERQTFLPCFRKAKLTSALGKKKKFNLSIFLIFTYIYL